ncbi:MAG: radical SAM protein [Candidatus Omnitrophica bacterium]|nr:radical SAM protein [Candidatus Omnitrophota bacterium]
MSTKEKNVPVNKGHFELETTERIESFRVKMSKGWEVDYHEYRRLWDELPQKGEVRDWPLLVDLELSSICNLLCPMCPTRTEDFQKKRNKKFMETSLAKKIIDEVSGHIFSLRLSWIGESTLHPDLLDIIRYAKSKGIQEVCFLTNGSRLDLAYFKKLTEAGLDWMTLSVDGVGAEYEAVRKPLKFADTLEHLKQIKQYKDENGLTKPVIKIQGVWPAIRPNPSEFYNTLAPYVDFIAFNPLIDYLHKDHDVVYEENFYCPQLYQRVVVASDGRASMCSSDDFVEWPVGDAKIQSIYDIWHGEKLNETRQMHFQKDGFMRVDPCRKCFYPRKMEINETAEVNGRTVQIQNYINRKQKIGE